MWRRPNPYRVLAHALDVGDLRLAELLALRLTEASRGGTPSTAAAQVAVERLVALLPLTEAPG
ncbi:MAG: hypothetical protein WKF33_00930 [Thermoleophilaceae bacterium]